MYNIVAYRTRPLLHSTERHMEIRVQPDSELPVYSQLKEQIKFLILSGELQTGAKLPSSRQLAGFLRINRNTVLKAYQELVRENLIECARGRGCVVVEPPKTVSQTSYSRLLAIVDEAIEQAVQLGVSPDDFGVFAYTRAKQSQEVRRKHRLVFVECEAPIASTLAQIIQDNLDIEVAPLVLQDLRQLSADVEQSIQDVDIVATTFFHIEEVKELLSRTNKKVVALAVKPQLDNLLQIARIPKGTHVLGVCVSAPAAGELIRSMEDAGIKGLDFSCGGTDDLKTLSKVLPLHPVVIASDFVAHEVRPLMQPDQKLIVLDYTTLDQGAMYLLRSMIGEEPPIA
jgi:GntR family transcriptional regulator